MLTGRGNMLIIDIDTVKGEETLRALCGKASYCAFHLPMFLSSSEKEQQKYKEGLKELLDGINDFVVEHYYREQFFHMNYNAKTEIYVFKCNDFFTDYLVKTNSIAKWLFPKLPEDLTFLDENKKIWLTTTTHEKDCTIYHETREDIEFLDKYGIEFDLWGNDILRDLPDMQCEPELEDKCTYINETLIPMLMNNGFEQRKNTFLKQVEDRIVLIVEVNEEFGDFDIEYGIFPLCAGIDDEFGIQPDELFDWGDLITGAKELQALVEIQNQKMYLDFMREKWRDIGFLEGDEWDVCFDYPSMCCALGSENYQDAKRYIDNEKDRQLRSFKRMIEKCQYDKIKDILKANDQKACKCINEKYDFEIR